MNLEFRKAEGSQPARPTEIDVTTSKTKVYIRRNINQVEKKDEPSGNTYQMWEYEEAITDKDGAIEYLSDRLGNAEEAINYLLMQ